MTISTKATIERLLQTAPVSGEERARITTSLQTAGEAELQAILKNLRQKAGTGKVQHKRQIIRHQI